MQQTQTFYFASNIKNFQKTFEINSIFESIIFIDNNVIEYYNTIRFVNNTIQLNYCYSKFKNVYFEKKIANLSIETSTFYLRQIIEFITTQKSIKNIFEKNSFFYIEFFSTINSKTKRKNKKHFLFLITSIQKNKKFQNFIFNYDKLENPFINN